MSSRINLLGVLEIEDESGTLSPLLKWNKGVALLSYLVVTGQPQRREQLADLLWDASSTSQSLRNLRTLLSRIRKWLPSLMVTRQQVAYEAESAVAIDYLTLTATLADGSITEINAALPLYRGDLLAGFFLDDAPRFNEWLLLEREQLRQQVVAAYRQICFAYSEQEAWAKGIDAAQRWLACDEFDEEALRHLLQFLAASGQVEVALQQYETSRQRLWAELMVEPAPETVQLAQRLQQLKAEKGSGLAWSAIVGAQVERPSPDQLSAPGKLPSNAVIPYQRNNDFTGRRESLLQLANWLLPNDGEGVRAVTIVGMGGLGKTQLAVEFCYRYGRFYPGGVYWLNFSDAKNIAEEVAALGNQQGMGLYYEADQLTLADRVGRVTRAWQEPIPRLLIFDNCEEEQLLIDWQPVSGGCHILLTSQCGTWSPELGLEQLPLGVLQPSESVMLLQKLFSALDPADANLIAAEVGHLPLALHLAGSFLSRYRQISPTHYLLQLRDEGVLQHPSLQGYGMKFSPTGHQLDVARTFAVNYAQFDPNDEADQMALLLLRRAAYFAPGEPIPRQLLLTTVVVDAADMMALLLVEDGLMRLVELGFLESEGVEWVVMHRLLAAFARELVVNGRQEQIEAQTAVSQAILHPLLPALGRGLYQSRLLFPVAHLHYVTNAALRRGEQVAIGLAAAYGKHLNIIAEFDKAHSYLEQAIKLAATHADVYMQGIVWLLKTYLLSDQGLKQESLDSIQEAERLLRLTGPNNPPMLAEVLKEKGWILSRLGRVEAALSVAEESRAVATQNNDHFATASALNLLGVLHYYMLDKYAEGDAYLEEALVLIREHDIPFNQSAILSNLGENARLQGDGARAVEWHQAALHTSREIGNSTQEVRQLNNLYGAQVEAGDYETAATGLNVLIGRVPSDWRNLSETNRHLAGAYLGLDQLAAALTTAQTALAQAEAIHNPRELAHAWHILGRVAARLCQPVPISRDAEEAYAAPACFEESLKRFSAMGLQRNRALVLWHWAEFELAHGNKEKGMGMWQEAQQIFEQLDLPLYLAMMA